MNELKPIQPPQSTIADKVIGAMKALAGELPGGSLASEVCGWFVRSPFERRTEEWQRTVGETLCELSNQRGVEIEELQKDDQFVDTVLHATQVALRNSHHEKREALRNAILNSALPGAPDESRRQMFLNYVDTFTPWHLRLLHLFNEPVEWFKARGKTWPNLYAAGRSAILDAAYPELKAERDLYDQAWRDLNTRGLVGTDSLHGMCSEGGLRQGLATATGKQFLAFISEPLRRKGGSSA